MKTFFSCGMGVQSAAMVAMIVNRDLPRPDGIFWCDNGGEFPWTYHYAQYLTSYAKKHGIEITKLYSGDIFLKEADFEPPFVSLPAYRIKGGKKQALRRACTSRYKIEPIILAIRQALGVAPGKWCKAKVIQWMGISYDERHRRTLSRTPWIMNEYPLVKKRMTRQDCIDYLIAHHIPIPDRSACVMCPYHSNETWRTIRDKHPESWRLVCWFDRAIRNRGPKGKPPIFLHRSCVPLERAKIDTKPISRGHHGHR